MDLRKQVSVVHRRRRKGQVVVTREREGQSFNKSIAALVAETWKGKCPRDLLVTHRDGDRYNNAPANLLYTTRAESVRARMPALNSQAKLTPDHVRRIRRLYREGWSGAAIARKYHISISAALSAAQGKTWKGVA